jgi:integrase
MTGCVFKRKLKSGTSWGYLFSAGKDASGKRNRIFKSGFATKGAAQSAVREAITEYETKCGRITEQVDVLGRRTWEFVLGDQNCGGFESRGAAENARTAEIERREAEVDVVVAEPTFADYFKYWTDEHAARRCAPKTLERYKELGRYLVKHLGETRINELTTAQIQHAIHRLKDGGGQITKGFPDGKPLAAKTVRHIGTLLHTSLAEADRLGILKIPHPMANKRVVLPKLPKRRPPVLDKEKLRVLFDRARGTRLYPLVVLASATGCRRGELLALEWSDLDEATSEINISKSLEQTKAGLRIKSTKSEEPRRFSVPEWALEVLRAHRQEQQRDRELFGNGAYYSPDRLGARVVETYAESRIGWLQPAFLAALPRQQPTEQWRTDRGRFPTLGAQRPEHHIVDLLPRVAGRHEGRGEDLERRHGGRDFGRPESWSGAHVSKCLHADGWKNGSL